METLFENNYTVTKELTKEIERYYWFQRPLMLAYDIMMVFLIFLGIEGIIAEEPYAFVAFIVGPLFIALQFYKYFRAVKVMVERDAEIASGSVIQVKTVVTDEIIRATSTNGAVYEIPLTKIKKFEKTKNLILLCSQANMVYIFSKDTFTKGTSQEFIWFLKQKGL